MQTGKTAVRLSVLAGLAAICAVWLWVQLHQDVRQLTVSSAKSDVARTTDPNDVASIDGENSDSNAPSNRAALPTRTKLSADGATDGFEVTWTPLLPTWLQSTYSWPDLDWSVLRDTTKTIAVDKDGSFEINALAPEINTCGSVIWCTRPGFSAKSIILDFPNAPALLPATINLEPSGDLAARVVDMEGRPVSGAHVTQLVYLGREDPKLGSGRELESKFVLRRDLTTGNDGRVKLSNFPVLNWVFADHQGLTSKAWAGTAPAEFELELRSSFTVGGYVSLDSGSIADERASVRACLRNGAEYRSLGRYRVRKDGNWGPAQLPTLPCEAFEFQLEGGELTRPRVVIKPPIAGETVRVDFRAQRGNHLPVCVLDKNGRPVSKANVYAQWMADGQWDQVDAYTDEHGNATLRGLIPGPVYLNVSAPGYVFQRLDAIQLQASRSQCIQVNLERAALVRGRCVHETQPVSEFVLRWWHNAPEDGGEVRVRNEPTGRFEIPEVPPGDVFLFAASKDYPKGEVIHIVADVDQAVEVALELPDALRGHGKVVDAISGEPVKDARIQLFTTLDGRQLEKYNSPSAVDGRGEFLVVGLAPGSNLFDVLAPGYAKRTIVATGRSGETVECGLITLFPKQMIECKLMGDNPAEFHNFSGELWANHPTARVPFSSDGVLRFEAMDPGSYSLRVYFPDNKSYQLFPVYLSAGKDQFLRVHVNARRMQIHVVPCVGQDLPGDLQLLMTSLSPKGDQVSRYYQVPSTGTVDAMRLEGRIVLTAVSEKSVISVADFDVGPSLPDVLEFHLRGTPKTFRIVDPAENPLVGVKLTMTRPEDNTGWFWQQSSGQNGEVTLTGVEFSDAWINLSRYPDAVQASIAVSLSTTGAPVDLVFNPNEVLQVLTLERDAAIPGLELIARDGRSSFIVGAASSNENGVARWALAKGRFRIKLAHPGYWPTEQIVDAGRADEPTPFQVRRLGAIEITVIDIHENPLTGISIDLYSEEMSNWVSMWISAGQVSSPVDGLKTDANGILRLSGLPNGSFRWNAVGPGGKTVEGNVVIAPGGTTKQTIKLP